MNAKDEIAKLMAKLNKDRAKQMFKDAGIEVDDSVFVDKSEVKSMAGKKHMTLEEYGDAMERRKDEMMERQNKDLLLEGLENGNKSLCQEINRLRAIIDDAFEALNENKTDAALKILEDAFDR